MNRFFALLTFLSIALLPSGSQALQITSLQPASGVPGDEVILGGNAWPDDFLLLIGETEVTFERMAAANLRFKIPDLPAGDYAVSLAGPERSWRSATPFTLKIVSPRPIIEDISPARIEACRQAGPENIVLAGRHFSPGAQVLLDEANIPITERSAQRITVPLPRLATGLHQLQVVNPDDRRSLPVAIEVVGTPQIDRLEIGESQVVSYPIRIYGSNFTPTSTLLVNGRAVVNRAPVLEEGDDSLTYLDCATLLYRRYPLTGQTRELLLQIRNPDGQLSNVLSLTAN